MVLYLGQLLTVHVLLFMWETATASVNLWLSKMEAKPSLGMATEVFYVQEGIVNEYAMNRRVPIQPNVSDLHFNWQRTTRRKVPYEISLEVSDAGALHQPSLNISASGSVPQDHQLFTVRLPCRPGAAAEVDVRLHITLLLPRQPAFRPRKTYRRLLLQHRRVCQPEVTATVAPRGGSDAELDAVAVSEDAEAETGQTMLLGIGGSCGGLLVLMVLLAGIISRNNALKRRKRVPGAGAQHDPAEQQLNVDSVNSCHTSSSHHYATVRPLPSCPSYSNEKTAKAPLGHSASLNHIISSAAESARVDDSICRAAARDRDTSSGHKYPGQRSAEVSSKHRTSGRCRDWKGSSRRISPSSVRVSSILGVSLSTIGASREAMADPEMCTLSADVQSDLTHTRSLGELYSAASPLVLRREVGGGVSGPVVGRRPMGAVDGAAPLAGWPPNDWRIRTSKHLTIKHAPGKSLLR